MKKARNVSEYFESGEPISFKDFMSLESHAKASATWYATTFSRNSGQVRKKLITKGYPIGPVKYISNGVLLEYDFVERTIEYLLEISVLDDYGYALAAAKREFSNGRGSSRVRAKLISNYVEPELADRVMNELLERDEQDAALSKAFDRAIKSYSYRNEQDAYKRKQKLVSGLMTRGFSYGDILEKYDEWVESLDED
jgi:SOS response regulatory protein OraA/RecX